MDMEEEEDEEDDSGQMDLDVPSASASPLASPFPEQSKMPQLLLMDLKHYKLMEVMY
jgi:hypothetical protein